MISGYLNRSLLDSYSQPCDLFIFVLKYLFTPFIHYYCDDYFLSQTNLTPQNADSSNIHGRLPLELCSQLTRLHRLHGSLRNLVRSSYMENGSTQDVVLHTICHWRSL